MTAAASLTQRSERRASSQPPAPSPDDCVRLTRDSLHDLASPINQICALSELILDKCNGALDDEAKVLLGFLHNSADRLQNLLGGLRTYAEVIGSAPSYRRCDGNALLAGALEMVHQPLAQSEALVTHDALPELCCDPGQITYAFASLIENSVKFRADRRPEIHVGVVPDKTAWVLSVRDNGIGIDPRYTDRIFSTFKRIHNEVYPGPGVGLAITKHVVERHGGRIWVESELGRGATFFVALPKVDEHGARPVGRKRPAPHRAAA